MVPLQPWLETALVGLASRRLEKGLPLGRPFSFSQSAASYPPRPSPAKYFRRL